MADFSRFSRFSRFGMADAARKAVSTSLAATLAISGLALPGCAAGDGTATDGAASTVPADGDAGRATEAEVDEYMDADLSVAPIDEEQVPQEYLDRVRSEVSRPDGEPLADEEVSHAAAMLHHLEEKYDLPFAVTDVTPPMNNGNHYTWVGTLECRDDGYAYSEEEATPTQEAGTPRTVLCYMHEGGKNPLMSDDFVIQLHAAEIRSAIEDATTAVMDEHGVELSSMSGVVPMLFKEEMLEDADGLGVDAKASEIIPLLEFNSVGTAVVQLPDGKTTREVADEVADDVRDAYGKLGISDEGRVAPDGTLGTTQWMLGLVFNGNVTGDPVLNITADDVKGVEMVPSV